MNSFMKRIWSLKLFTATTMGPLGSSPSIACYTLPFLIEKHRDFIDPLVRSLTVFFFHHCELLKSLTFQTINGSVRCCRVEAFVPTW
jgi:hypothetical protein